ncbi:MAG TPA: TonB-dependent receptor [Tenuifilaceae bacterium]|nr:TonB-dependent receptor [Tenuifilaceae bacterium]
MIRRLIKTAFLTATIGAFCIAALAQGKVEVVVIEKLSGNPIVGAHVTLGKSVMVTNDRGELILENLTNGSYKLTVSAVGFVSQVVSITISDTKTQRVEIPLEEDKIYLDEVIIAATRTESRIGDIPGRVEVITPEKITFTSYQSVDELLSTLTGVHTGRSYGLFSYRATVSMRGVSGKEQARVLVLLNGVPVNKADGGSVNWNLISTGEIERIEVIKGPGSALYGGNAMGGIINVVTRKPTEKIEGSVTASYGTYNTKGVNAKLSGKLNNGFYWAANGLFRNSDGYITQSFADQQANPYIVNSTFEEKVLHLKTGYDGGEKLSAEVDFTLFDDVRTTGEKVFQPLGNTREYDTYQFRTIFKGKAGAINWSASAFFQREYYQRLSEWMKDDYTWYDVLSLRSDYGLLTNASYTAGNHVFTTGVDARLGEVDASDVYYTSTDKVDNRGKTDFIGVYLQDEIGFFDNAVKLTAGLRYDYSRFYDGEFVIHTPSGETDFMYGYQFSGQSPVSWGALSPRLSVQYKPNNVYRVYASYSRGFRPSVLDDLCRSGRVRGGFKVANPNLTPEYLDNFEVGGDYKPRPWIRVASSLFYSKGTDFLYYVTTGETIDMGFGPRPIMIRKNISGVNILGNETEITVSLTRYLNLFGGYAYAYSKISSYTPIDPNDFDLTGKFLTDVPMHSFNAGGFVRTRFVNASVTAKYVGKMYINDQNEYDDWVLSNQLPAAFNVDLKLSKEFLKHFDVSLNIQNILDKKIHESNLSVGPGRFIMVELKAKI